MYRDDAVVNKRVCGYLQSTVESRLFFGKGKFCKGTCGVGACLPNCSYRALAIAWLSHSGFSEGYAGLPWSNMSARVEGAVTSMFPCLPQKCIHPGRR